MIPNYRWKNEQVVEAICVELFVEDPLNTYCELNKVLTSLRNTREFCNVYVFKAINYPKCSINYKLPLVPFLY